MAIQPHRNRMQQYSKQPHQTGHYLLALRVRVVMLFATSCRNLSMKDVTYSHMSRVLSVIRGVRSIA